MLERGFIVCGYGSSYLLLIITDLNKKSAKRSQCRITIFIRYGITASRIRRMSPLWEKHISHIRQSFIINFKCKMLTAKKR